MNATWRGSVYCFVDFATISLKKRRKGGEWRRLKFGIFSDSEAEEFREIAFSLFSDVESRFAKCWLSEVEEFVQRPYKTF